ncbi:hypothetical protein V6N13_000924 [Hibiscus sabdariffa]|uniref:Carbohydrate kinase PfkB domain-containing protein n=1 Tax=Hibiscus sabdariffa TaxID=183260 RepID=A0ABR2G6R4_9ROSI
MVDPTGVGDSFLGGFVGGLVHGLVVPDVVLVGNLFGSLAVGEIGLPKFDLRLLQLTFSYSFIGGVRFILFHWCYLCKVAGGGAKRLREREREIELVVGGGGEDDDERRESRVDCRNGQMMEEEDELLGLS